MYSLFNEYRNAYDIQNSLGGVMKSIISTTIILFTSLVFADLHTVCHLEIGVCDYITIQSALDDILVVDNDTVLVEMGTYYENLIIQKSVILISRAVYGYEEEELQDSWYNWVGEAEDGSWEMQNPYINHTIIDGSADTNDRSPFRSSIMVNSPPNTGDQFERAIEPRISGFTIQNGMGTQVMNTGDQFERELQTESRGGGIYSNNAFPTISFNAIVSNTGDQFERAAGGGISRGGAIFLSTGDQFERTGSVVIDTWDDFDHSLYRDDIDLSNNAFSGNDANYQSTAGTENFNGFVDMSDSFFDVFSGGPGTGSGYATPPWVDGGEGDDVEFDFTGGQGDLASITTDVWVTLDGDDSSTTGDGNGFKTIEWAIKMIDPLSNENGKTVINIGAGTFSPDDTGEEFPIIMFSNIDLTGQGEEETFLDADYTGKVIVFEFSTNNTVSELTLLNGCSGEACGDTYIDNNTNGIFDEGDELVVDVNENGIYDEADDFRLYQGGGVFSHSSNPNFQDVTISNNTGISGGGMYFQSSTSSLNNVDVKNNIAHDAGGIRAVGSKLIISGSDISSNQANDSGENDLGIGKGGGMRISQISNVAMGNSRIDNNSATYGGGLFIDNDSNLDLVNVTIFENSAHFSGFYDHEGGTSIYVESADVTMSNVTITDNFGEGGNEEEGSVYIESIYVLFDSNVQINNSILWNLDAYFEITVSELDIGVGVPTVSYDYSNILSWYGYQLCVNPATGYLGGCDLINDGIGDLECFDTGYDFYCIGTQNNILYDPRFTNPGIDDYTLNEFSPLIDHGNTNSWYNDLDGTTSDIGMTGGSYLLPSFTDYYFGEIGQQNSSEFQTNAEFTLHNFRESAVAINNITFSDNFDNTVFSSTVSSLSILPNSHGTIPINCNIDVDQEAYGSMNIGAADSEVINGASVSLSALGIAGFALNGTLEGNIPGGTYPVTGDLIINQDSTATFAPGTKLQFKGEYSFTVNGILKAEGTGMNESGMIIFENHPDNDGVKWKGFTLNNQTESTIFKYVRISGAHKNTGGGMALSNSSPMMEYVTISDNSSQVVAGGMHIAGGSDLTLSNCIIENNTAGLSGSYGGGGGLWIEETSNLRIENSVITNNSTNVQEAGGIMLQSSYRPVLKNVEITGNSGPDGGGLVIESSYKPKIQNVTIASNTSAVGSGIYIYGSTSEPRIINTIVQNNYSQSDVLDSESSITLQSDIELVVNYSNLDAGCIDSSDEPGVWVDQIGDTCSDWASNGDACSLWGDSDVDDNNEEMDWPNGNATDNCCACGGGIRTAYGTSEESIWSGTENIDEDPLFTSDYTLQNGSSSIDAGIAYFVLGTEELVDISEEDYYSCAPDMGAYESSGVGSDCSVSGDVNLDGTLNIVDLIIIVDHILGYDLPAGYDISMADINQDGVVEITDLVLLIESMFNLLGRTVDIVDEITIYKSDNKLLLDSEDFVALEIEISHSNDFNYTMIDDALLSGVKTENGTTHMIIVDPTSDILFESEETFVIEKISAIGINGESVQVNILDIPIEFKLSSAYPNPFNPSTTLDFTLPLETEVTIVVYNLQGQVISTLADDLMSMGYYSVVWDARQYSSGVYFIRFVAGEYSNTQKLMLIK